jgi:SET domain-containing protein
LNFSYVFRPTVYLPADLESHGGLYTLHSHLNHSCTPNTSIRHIDQRSALSRITAIASNAILAGEELLITYVNPEASVNERRKGLLEWGFGECRCQRCVEEAKLVKPNDGAETLVMDVDGDLERELKAGLGVI